MRTPSLLALLLSAALCATVPAITVSGVVSTSDSSSPAGFAVTVEQVGGELPLFHATTGANGTWSVSDPLLFGNIRVTVAKAGYRFTPPEINRFTSSNISDANFLATPLQADLSVLGSGGSLTAGGTIQFENQFPGGMRTVTLTLRNDGDAPMSGIAVTFTGAQAAEFSLVAAPPSTLAIGASTVVTILWAPASEGNREAALSIASNDPDENPFTLILRGEALPLDLITVSATTDSGPGSLRSALAQAAAVSGAQALRLSPSLSGGQITLASEIVVNDSAGVTLDATGLPGGLTLAATNGSRHFRVPAGSQLTLAGLTLRDGRASGEDRGGSIRNEGTLNATGCRFTSNSAPLPNSAGGAIYNEGTLTFARCVLISNHAQIAAGLYNQGIATLTESSIAANGSNVAPSGSVASEAGGGILSIGTLVLSRCTVSTNAVRTAGAGLHLSGTANLQQCTIHGNVATSGPGGSFNGTGGGIFVPSGNITFSHCTITGNTGYGIYRQDGTVRLTFCLLSINTFQGRPAAFGGFAPFFADGPNLTDTSTLFVGPTPIVADALIGPFTDYGGPTLTRALLPGSPARNAATGSTITSDQRGLPVIGVPDLGAYEAGTVAFNYNAYIQETLPAFANDVQRFPGSDFDGDGRSNFDEWLALTDAANASSVFAVTIGATGPAGTDLAIDFRSAAGRRYTLQQSTSLEADTFSAVPGQPVLDGTGAVLRFTATPSGGKRFFRVAAGP